MEEDKPLLTEKKILFSQKLILGVEPILFLFIFTASISDTLFSNLMLNKTCTKVNILGTCESEIDSQLLASQLSTAKSFISVIMAMFVSMFAGSQVDRNLKYLKPFLLFPIIVHIFLDFLNIANVLVLNLNAFTSTVYATILAGVGGSLILILMMSATYVSHESTKEERTVRMGYLLFSFTFGGAIGNLVGGYVVQYIGYFTGYFICLLSGFMTLGLAGIFIDNLKGMSTLEPQKSRSIIGTIADGWKILRKSRPNKKRLMIHLLVLAFVAVHSYPYGEATVHYYFVRNEFDWKPTTFGTYTFCKQMIKSFGTVFVSEILKRRLKLRDATIGIVAGVFEFSYCLSWFFVQQDWQIYLASCLNMFEKVIHSLCLSLASKCVEPDEYGRLSSLFSISNFIIPFTNVLYTVVYDLTISSYPRAIYILSLILSAPVILLYSILLKLTRRLHIPDNNGV